KVYAGNPVRPPPNRTEVARTLERRGALPCRSPFRRAQVLRGRDAPLSQRQASHGPRAQLFDRRRPGVILVEALVQRAAPDGLGCLRPAGGECRHRAWPSSTRVDVVQHRRDERANAPHGIRLRLAARNLELRAGILPVEPVVLLENARARAGVSQAGAAQLVPGMRYCSGERAGGGRVLLAPRNDTSGAARARAVVLENY